MTGMSSIENGDTTVEDNAPCAKKDKVEFGKKEKQQLLIKAVKALEDSTWPNDDASTFSSTWEVLFRKLDPNQQLFANKTNMEVLYQGTLVTTRQHVFIQEHCSLKFSISDFIEQFSHSNIKKFPASTYNHRKP
nr:uncharacterized protein LOC118683679 isoform X2 [Bactrocera oleae]